MTSGRNIVRVAIAGLLAWACAPQPEGAKRESRDAESAEAVGSGTASPDCLLSNPLPDLGLQLAPKTDAKKLNVRTPVIRPFSYGDRLELLIDLQSGAKSEKEAPDWGYLEVHNGKGEICHKEILRRWFQQLALPDDCVGTLKIRAAGCLDKERRSTADACGAFSQTRYHYEPRTSPKVGKITALMRRNQREREQIALDLVGPARDFLRDYTIPEPLPDEEKLWVDVARSLSARPHEIAAVYGSYLYEVLFAEAMQSYQAQAQSAQLAGNTGDGCLPPLPDFVPQGTTVPITSRDTEGDPKALKPPGIDTGLPDPDTTWGSTIATDGVDNVVGEAEQLTTGESYSSAEFFNDSMKKTLGVIGAIIIGGWGAMKLGIWANNRFRGEGFNTVRTNMINGHVRAVVNANPKLATDVFSDLSEAEAKLKYTEVETNRLSKAAAEGSADFKFKYIGKQSAIIQLSGAGDSFNTSKWTEVELDSKVSKKYQYSRGWAGGKMLVGGLVFALAVSAAAGAFLADTPMARLRTAFAEADAKVQEKLDIYDKLDKALKKELARLEAPAEAAGRSSKPASGAP